MRKPKIIGFFMTFVITGACGEISYFDSAVDETATAGTQQNEMHGGTALTAAQVRRSGVVEVLALSECTGSVISTSAFRRETWVLTAAHCFDELGPGSVTPNYVTLRQVFLGTPEYPGPANSGTVYLHPGFDDSHSPPRHDIVLVRFPFGVKIDTPNGATLREYYRPVSGMNTYVVGGDAVAVFGSGNHNGGDYDLLCNVDPQSNDDDTVRYATGYYEPGSYGVISVPGLGSNNWTLSGDSGGPYMTALGHASASIGDYLNDGVITAVHTGSQCSVGDVDHVASSTYAGQNHDFLVNTAGDNVHVLYNTSWTRTCWKDWCYYDDQERAALTMAALATS